MDYSHVFGKSQHPPCANCGKENGGFMRSTEWGHDYSCCSNTCGFRLKQKLENGMAPGENHYTEREEMLRNRIRQLKHRLKKTS